MRDDRLFVDLERDLRVAFCTLLQLPTGSVHPRDENGTTPTGNAPWATLKVVHVDFANPQRFAVDQDAQNIRTMHAEMALLRVNVGTYREGAFQRASFASRRLAHDAGAQLMRSIAVGVIDARAVDITSRVISTKWEEQAVLIATISAMLSVTEIENAIVSVTTQISRS